jgi:adenylosuccinate synthase
MSVTVVLGTQWGDEGKAKFVDFFSAEHDIIARFAGGANAGHTVIKDGQKYIFHLIPSGILYQDKQVVIGNGVVLDYTAIIEEMHALEIRGIEVLSRLLISDAAHVILPHHKMIDSAGESMLGSKKIGTTGRGIGPAYQDKMSRRGLRAGELKNPVLLKERLKAILEFKNRELKNLYNLTPVDLNELYDELLAFYEIVKKCIINTPFFLYKKLQEGKKVMLEGAQATGLDIDHGTYPFVTSSNPSIGGAITGSGIPPKWIERIIGISKAYTTRVGSGPFPSEETGKTGETIRTIGGEFGATTGRPRRCGWLDIEELKMSVRVNGITEIALTKMDVLDDFETIKMVVGYKLHGKKIECFPSDGLEDVEPLFEECPGWKTPITKIRSFEDLPQNARDFLKRIEDWTSVPIKSLSVGPERDATITK